MFKNIIKTISKIFSKKNDKQQIVDKTAVKKDRVHGLTQKAYDLIIKYETGGQSYYEKALKRPTYPGGQSGVTIGIGYDLGYNTPDGFARDWKNRLEANDFSRLQATLGLKGKAAASKITCLRDINIEWDQALDVFNARTLPRFINLTKSSFPGSEGLKPDAFGALVSLVFNRGGSTKGSTRIEMKNIKMALSGEIKVSNIYDYIADQIIAMKRLWKGKGLDGLLTRRDAEAKMIRDSI